jgi:hypothetical protein
LKIPARGTEYSLTENVTPPFQAEPTHFTLSLLNGLLLGSVSANDDSITADSLFKHVKAETKSYTNDRQVPEMSGTVAPQISIYLHKPAIIRGISRNVSEKSAYYKLIAIIKTIGKSQFESSKDLYARILQRYEDAFLTNFIDEHRRVTQRPAKWQVLRRYVSFLRAIRVLDEEELRLTARGRKLLSGMEMLYNTRLQVLLVEYLESQRGLTVDVLRNSMQRVMERRWLPF